MRPRLQRNGVGDSCHRWYEPQTGRYVSADPHARKGWLGLDLLYSYAASRPTAMVDPLGLKVEVGDTGLQDDYDRLKKCYPLFRSVADHFESDNTTWKISRPDDRGFPCSQGGNRFSDRHKIWVPQDLGCKESLRCIFHEFYERWAIDGAGFPKTQMGGGAADDQARHFEQLLPGKKCCECDPGSPAE